MNITNFTLPKTAMSVVVWYRGDKRNEQLIPTPVNNQRLTEIMFADHKVGRSEIRAVKPVTGNDMFRGFHNVTVKPLNR